MKVTRGKVCPTSKVERYTAKRPPRCNRGLGCVRCWKKWVSVNERTRRGSWARVEVLRHAAYERAVLKSVRKMSVLDRLGIPHATKS